MPPHCFRRLRRAAAAFALLLAGCAPTTTPSLAAAAPLPPGAARVWFYRVFFPGDTIDMPAIAINGRTVGYAIAGQRFYRDVPAGSYHVTVETVGRDTDQSQTIALAPGEQRYLAIQSAPEWVTQGREFEHGTYYVRTVPARLAPLELAETRLGSGY